MGQKENNGPWLRLGGAPREATHQGAPGGPGAPWWVVPTSGAPRTASLLYKYPKNTTRSNLDTITEGFTTSIGASPMMRE